MIKVLVIINFISLTKLSCVARGKESDSSLIFYNGSAVQLDGEGIGIYEKYCLLDIEINHKKGENISTCCDIDQLRDFASQALLLDGLVTSCEICRLNIYRLTCSFICSPRQSEFVFSNNITNTSVHNLNFAISYDSIESIFNSCKDVLMPGSNAKVILMMCLEEFGKCNPINFILSLMKYSPLEINPFVYNLTSKRNPKFKSLLNFMASKCNEPHQVFDRKIGNCACQDCANSCPAPKFPSSDVKKILNLSVYQFFISLIYGTIIASYVFYFIFNFCRSRHQSILYENDPLQEADDLDVQQIQNENSYIMSYEPNAYEFQIKFYRFIQGCLRRWGILISTNIFMTIFISLILITVLSGGVTFHLKIVSDPILMWSPPHDIFRKQKDFYDKNMGPSYRIEQIILTTPNLKPTKISIMGINSTFGPPLNEETIFELFKIQENINKIYISYNNSKTVDQYRLKDLCVKPTSPYNENCLTLSITQYFQNNPLNFALGNNSLRDWHTHLDRCTYNPANVQDSDFFDKSCLGDFEGTIDPKLVLGGYDQNPTEATALIVTYLLNSHLENEKNIPALLWEKELKSYLESYKHQNIILTYRTERSLQDEIDRQSHTESIFVFLSYALMFVYVCFSLGKFTFSSFKAFFIKQKIVLGLVGVLIVFFSLLSSIGFFCYLKYDLNIIILEVLPFLALAVGVDNLFLLVHEYRLFCTLNPVETPIPTIVGEVLSTVGPGMIVSSFAQIITFSIGALSNIPAVKCFSLFAAVTIAINFILQMTLFMAAFTLDITREKNNVLDVFFFLRDQEYVDQNSFSVTDFAFQFLSKFVFSKYIRPLIISVFITVWFCCIIMIPGTPMNLEPTDTLPHDSHLILYFRDVFDKLKSGPMLYLIVEPDFHYENEKNLNMICSGPNCNHNSLTNILNEFSSVPYDSKIATKTFSWVDAYIAWLTPNEQFLCCAQTNDLNRTFYPSYSRKEKSIAVPCFSVNSSSFKITSKIFSDYLPWFLSDIPTAKCPYGGKPLYGHNVILNDEFYFGRNKSASPVYTSAFISFHTSLVKSEDFKIALTRSLFISKNITEEIKHKVYPYSDFYIFYGYYLSLWKEASISFGLAFVGVLIVNIFLYAFNIRMIIIITLLTFLMTTVNFGLMNLLSINFNPVSLVNLIMLVGINVEFLSHIGRSYLLSKSPLVYERAQITFVETGPSVFSGITMTKIIGILVLGASNSDLFKTYFFKMYLFAIISGFLHALLILPVLLHYVGPKNRYIIPEQDSHFIIRD